MYKTITTNYIMDNLTRLKKARETNMYLINKVALNSNSQLPTEKKAEAIYLVSESRVKQSNLNLFIIQPIDKETFENVGDSWITISDKEDLTELGYFKVPNNLFFVKYREITYMELTEEMELSVSWLEQKILGKKGDYLVIAGSENYNLITKEVFNSIYTKVD